MWQQWELCHHIITPSPALSLPQIQKVCKVLINHSGAPYCMHTLECHHILIQKWLTINEVCGSFYALIAKIYFPLLFIRIWMTWTGSGWSVMTRLTSLDIRMSDEVQHGVIITSALHHSANFRPSNTTAQNFILWLYGSIYKSIWKCDAKRITFLLVDKLVLRRFTRRSFFVCKFWGKIKQECCNI